MLDVHVHVKYVEISESELRAAGREIRDGTLDWRRGARRAKDVGEEVKKEDEREVFR